MKAFSQQGIAATRTLLFALVTGVPGLITSSSLVTTISSYWTTVCTNPNFDGVGETLFWHDDPIQTLCYCSNDIVACSVSSISQEARTWCRLSVGVDNHHVP
jgi:hypothetical protein